jgi:hypothetical protein
LCEPPDEELVESLALVQVAKWAGLPAWELANKPVYWLDLYRLAMEIERDTMSKSGTGLLQ